MLISVSSLGKQREKNRFVIDKNQPYGYNNILGELCNEGIIDIFGMTEALIILRILYNIPVSPPFKKKSVYRLSFNIKHIIPFRESS